ncbi:uncharacterized protein si:dkey-250k15.4 [Cheilinus undulatus]|uniref:uncharacterized protein si:dkey-250k15.4 n=1 Tax=Cheilinus undulatus TaxID=241271 RepID=UPI001BD47941|nr:uncharacterized protein si:dkey-250k15.4 [Cheilinus undulatus]
MSHMCGRSLPDKGRFLNVFNKPLKTTDKNCCSVNRSAAGSKCSNRNSKTDGQHRIKRFKSRKERSQMRSGGKEASRLKSHHHHCHRQSSRDITYVYDRCCHSSCNCSCRQDAPFPNVVPAAQEPSIITESRLIGHHGLFNHEVKSIDIERLLSRQMNVENSGVRENNNSTSHPSSVSRNPFPFSCDNMVGAEPEEVVTIDREADFSPKAYDNCQEKEKRISQEADVTQGPKTNPVTKEKGSEPQLTPIDSRDNVMKLKKVEGTMFFSPENTPKNQESPIHQIQSHGVSQTPPQLSSPHAAHSSDSQHRPDSSSLTESVSAVVTSLCGCLQFPLLRRRNLVAESREVLLKALKKRHGSRLQENLFRLQQCHSFGSDHSKKDKEQELTMIEEDELQQTDSFSTVFDASKPFFDTRKTRSLTTKGSVHFNLKSSPQMVQNMRKTSEWFRGPEETSALLLDDNLRPPCSPEFGMDFRCSGIRDHLFAPSPTSCWGEKYPPSPLWGGRSSRPDDKDSLMFDFFENGFLSQTRAPDGPQNSISRTPKFLSYQTQLLERRSTEPINFPQKQDLFDTERYSLPPSLSSQMLSPERSHSFQPFSQPSIHPPLRAHHTDMIHYPPSHMLEKESAPSLSTRLSPEHWSFPPMRLY